MLDEVSLSGQSSGKMLSRAARALNTCGLLQEVYQGQQSLSRAFHGLVVERAGPWDGEGDGWELGAWGVASVRLWTDSNCFGKSQMNALQTSVFPPYQKSHKYVLQLPYLIPGGPEKKLQMILLIAWFQKPTPYK